MLCVGGLQAAEQLSVVSAVARSPLWSDKVPPRTLPSFFQTAQISLQQPQSAAAGQKLAEFEL